MNTDVYYADAYLRISKEEEDKVESNSIVNQKALIKQFLNSNPNIHLYKERIDDGYTGVNFERPAFQAMMEDIKSGRINCVIVKDLSRFGRNYIETGRYIEKIFPYLNIRFIAINDEIDSIKNNMMNDMIIPFKNLMNDSYSRDISIKVKSNLDVKRKNGEFIGAFAPYGYKKTENNKNKLVIDEKVAPYIRNIFQWKIEGISSSHIANKLNTLGIATPMQHKLNNGENYYCGYRTKSTLNWNAHTVNYILKNPVYTGTLVQGKVGTLNYKLKKRIQKEEKDFIRCENTHEPIISQEEFEIVQKLFKNDTRVAPRKNKLYLFSGIVKCGYCKANLIRKTIPYSDTKYVYLICSDNKKNKVCKNNKYISLQKLEKVVLQVINLHIEKIIEIEKILQMIEETPYKGYKIEEIEMEIEDKSFRMESFKKYSFELYEDYKENLITKEEFIDLKNYYMMQINKLQESMNHLFQEKENIKDNKNSHMEWIQHFTKNKGFEILTRPLLLSLIETIYVYDKDRIEVVFQFSQEYEKVLESIREFSNKTREERT